MQNSLISKFEKKVIIIVFLFSLSLFGVWKSFLWNDGYGDDSFLAQLTSNIAHTGKPMTQCMSSIDIVLKEIVTRNSDVLCTQPLPTPERHEINYFTQWHTYFILYFLTPLTLLLGTVNTLGFCIALSFLSVLLLAYLYLREKGVSTLPALSFVLLLTAHPGWSQSLQGQIYVDRLFIGLAFLLLYSLDKFPNNKRWLLIIAILCTSVSERFGILVGGLLIGKEILFWTQKKSLSRFNLYLGAGCALFSIILIKFIVHHPHYASFASSMTPAGFIGNLKSPAFVENLWFFLSLNIVVFGLLGIFSWRYYLLALGLMLPNILGNIGGAEKTGFTTHYHSTYLPVLLFCLCDAFIKIYNYFKNKPTLKTNWRVKNLLISSVIMIAAITIIGCLDYNTTHWSFSWSKLANSSLYVGPRDTYSYLFGQKHKYLTAKDTILDIIPVGKSVATTEQMMPLFALTREVHLYPVGLDNADYLVLPVTNLGAKDLIFSGATSYVPTEMEIMNKCFSQRIAKNYDVPNMKIVEGYAIIKRKD